MQDDYLRIKNINKIFGKLQALENINFTVRKGEFISLVGPSGCGKSTLLRILAGLETEDVGEIFLDKENITKLPTKKRDFGIVFQSYALFPNMNVFENISFGLKNRGLSKEEINKKVISAIEMVELTGFEKKYPNKLSGGQQQRVALARAIVLEPKFLLLDEPLSALDAKVKVKLRKQLKELQQRLNITTIMVTHDQEEALSISERIVVMNKGKIEQVGTPEEVYESPASDFVADFIGTINEVKVQGEKRLVRPEKLNIVKDNMGEYKICNTEFRGMYYRVYSKREEEQEVIVDINKDEFRRLNLNRGDIIRILEKEDLTLGRAVVV